MEHNPDWARQELAPLALDAYADAYSEFRNTLLLFVYDSTSESPASKHWSLDDRENLGHIVFSTLRQATGDSWVLKWVENKPLIIISNLVSACFDPPD